MSKDLIILSAVMLTLAIGDVACGGRPEQGEKVAKGASDEAAAAYHLEEAKAFQLAHYTGKVVLLNFWATWCGPCRREIPEFIALRNKYRDQDFEMIGIALDRGGAEAIKPFADEMGINYTLVIDSEQEIARTFGEISSIPTTFVLDQEGKIQNKWVGYTPRYVREMEEMIQTLLASGGEASEG